MYNHTCKITLSNGMNGELKFPMPTTSDEWIKRVRGDGEDALSRINELTVRSFVIAAQSGARKCKTLDAATRYITDYVFGEKGSPRPVSVSGSLKWTSDQLAEFKRMNIVVE